MLNPRKELKRERRVRSEERRVKIKDESPSIRPHTKGQAATPPRPATANGVRGIKYAICLHNRTHRTAA